MATFSSQSFNASSYAAYRLKYPDELYELILGFHKTTGGTDEALDLGCGPGQVSKILSRYFKHVTGTDQSAVMIEEAKVEAQKAGAIGLDFTVTRSEDLNKVFGRASIDLVTAGQAAHWFDHERLWPVLADIVKPGGTIAFFGYSDVRIVDHPEVTPIIHDFARNPAGIAQYWQQPGRDWSENHLRDIQFPSGPEWDVSSAHRVHFVGEWMPEWDMPYYPLRGRVESERDYKTDAIATTSTTLEEFDHFTRTWSGVHTYLQMHPEDAVNKGRGSDGDIVDRYINTLRETVGVQSLQQPLKFVWPIYLWTIKRSI